MNNKLIPLCITLVVGIILAGSILMPVLNHATEVERTFTNEGLWRMSAFEEGDVWEMSEAGVWTLNGEPAITTDNSNSSVIIGDDWTIRGTGAIYGHTIYNVTPATVTVTVGDDSTSVNSGTISNVNGFGVNPEGNYLMTEYNKPVYIKGDTSITSIYATGYTNVATYGVVIHIEGSVNDGVTVTCSTINNTSALSNFTVSNLVVDAPAVEGYNDLYKLKGITFTLDFDYTAGGTTTHKTGDVSYSSYVVPYEVTAERTVHFTSGENALINAIPIMVIIALVVAAAGAIYIGRKD